MTAIKTLFISIAFIVIHQSAFAAKTYYVDSSKGNDSWSGNFPEPVGAPAGDGPWQTLAKLAQAPLQPGDTVALRCGRSWTETLKISASGSASASINITSYPADCSSLPTLEGAYPLPAHLWSKHGTNVYKADLSSANLLAGSRFDSGMTGWRVWSAANDAELNVATSCGSDSATCMKFRSGTGSADSVAYSNTFSILAGASYQLKFQFKAATNTRVRVLVRQNVSPWDPVGINKIVVGTGEWQQISLPFTGGAQIPDARLDFEIGPGGYTAYFDNIRVEPQFPSPMGARLGDEPLIPAHHPNRGFNPKEPDSMYVRNVGGSNRVSTADGGIGSTYITQGSDLQLPAGASLQPGLGISIRTNAWLIDDRKIASISGTTIFLDRPTSYPLGKGWGYFLTGGLWMVDEPNEWHFDAVSKTVYLATPSDSPPSQTVYLTGLDTCIDVSRKQYIRIKNVSAKGCVTGVHMEHSTGVVLNGLRVSHMSKVGVYAAGAFGATLAGMTIERVGTAALIGIEFQKGSAVSLTLTDSIISDAGVARVNGKVVSLPTDTKGAVIGGPGAKIKGNIIRRTAYHGIRLSENSQVENNVVDDACLVLDDCAAIYTTTPGSQIVGNIVRGVHGSVAGKPSGTTSQAEGIYLDDHANSISVINNTVSDAEHGLFLHNSFNNVIQGNTVYGNRRGQIWLMEDMNALDSNGDVHGNKITDNHFFSLVPSASVSHDTTVSDTARFAIYDQNRYSNLISTTVVNETSPRGNGAFSFKEWQSRNQDLNGSVVSASGYASYKVLGSNIVQNGSLSNGAAGWTPWNLTGSIATMQTSTCGAAPCLEFVAGGSPSLIASPPFSVAGGAWYRVTFDILSPAGASISVSPRRGGGGENGYEYLSNSVAVTANQTIRRVSFGFRSSKSVNKGDADTGDIGARLYFDKLLPGQKVYIANLEIVPISPSEESTQTRLLTNPSGNSISQDCPDEGSSAQLCDQYVDFASDTKLTWPTDVAAYSARIVYTRNLSMIDTDGDSITDSQDTCANTPAGAAVNAVGCGLGQQ